MLGGVSEHQNACVVTSSRCPTGGCSQPGTEGPNPTLIVVLLLLERARVDEYFFHMDPSSTNRIPKHVEILYRDGITALKGAFSPQWVEQCREDMLTAFWEAIQRPGGAVGRGPRR